jgi:hypothetical protein
MSQALSRDLAAETARDGTGFLTLNGSYCTLPGDLSRGLEEGDEVRLLPFVAGDKGPSSRNGRTKASTGHGLGPGIRPALAEDPRGTGHRRARG